MKNLAFYFSIVCLLLTVIPSFFVYMGIISLELNKNLMLLGTIGWFGTAPFWMNRKQNGDVSSETSKNVNF